LQFITGLIKRHIGAILIPVAAAASAPSSLTSIIALCTAEEMPNLSSSVISERSD